jgi:hypothetical protein
MTVRMPVQRTLLSQGRAIYGDCVRAPNLETYTGSPKALHEPAGRLGELRTQF